MYSALKRWISTRGKAADAAVEERRFSAAKRSEEERASAPNPHPPYPLQSSPANAAAGSTPTQIPHARTSGTTKSHAHAPTYAAPGSPASTDTGPVSARTANSTPSSDKDREKHSRQHPWLVSYLPHEQNRPRERPRLSPDRQGPSDPKSLPRTPSSPAASRDCLRYLSAHLFKSCHPERSCRPRSGWQRSRRIPIPLHATVGPKWRFHH